MLNLINYLKFIRICKQLKNYGKGFSIGKSCQINDCKYISIGNNTHIGNFVSICTFEYFKNKKVGYQPSIVIGDDVSITDFTYISCVNSIYINNGTLIGRNVFITDNFHGNSTLEECNIPPDERDLYCKGPVFIGKNVWIGKNVCIMPNVKIGDYAIIGANAVVTHDIPAYAVAGGVPARVIKMIK